MLSLQCTSVSRKIEICARRSQRYVSGKVYEYIQSARVPHQRSSKDEVRRRFSLGARRASHFGQICNRKTKTTSIPQVPKKLQKPSMVTEQIQHQMHNLDLSSKHLFKHATCRKNETLKSLKTSTWNHLDIPELSMSCEFSGFL